MRGVAESSSERPESERKHHGGLTVRERTPLAKRGAPDSSRRSRNHRTLHSPVDVATARASRGSRAACVAADDSTARWRTRKSSIQRRGEVAEGEGFEPPEPFPVQWFSRPPPSTTRPSLRVATCGPDPISTGPPTIVSPRCTARPDLRYAPRRPLSGSIANAGPCPHAVRRPSARRRGHRCPYSILSQGVSAQRTPGHRPGRRSCS